MSNISKMAPRKLQKASPASRNARYIEIVSGPQTPKPPRRNPSKITKAPPVGLSLRNSSDSISVISLDRPRLDEEIADLDLAMNEAPEPDLSSYHLGAPRSVRSRLWRACEKLKILARGQKHREEVEKTLSSDLSDDALLIQIMNLKTMSEEQKTLRESQVAIFKYLLSEFKHDTSLLDYRIKAPNHNCDQAVKASKMKDNIAPAGAKLNLFLTLIRLEGELNKSTLDVQQLYTQLIEDRKWLQSEIKEAEADFRLAYEELASRDRGALEDEYWNIFDMYQWIIWEDWPLPL